MVLSALLHPSRSHPAARGYRRRIARRPIVISFVVLTELCCGALKSGWGELRGRAPERWVAATALYLDIDLVCDGSVVADVAGLHVVGR